MEQRWVGPVHAEPEEAPRYWLPGGFDKIRLTSARTGGSLGITESEESNGDAPPLHVHEQEDETYYIIEGLYTFVIGDRTFRAGAGSLVFAPRGIEHAYRVDSERGRYLCAITPGGWETFFAQAGVPADETFEPPDEEPDWDRIDAIAGRFGVRIVGPPVGPPQGP